MIKQPRLLFFQSRYEKDIPEFLLVHKLEHVRTLEKFFDVVVVSHDCDYQQVCDLYEPDLAIFESGLEVKKSHRLNIKNVVSSAGKEVPRVGFLNSDGCSELRTGIVSDMESWGIETVFTISLAAIEHSPNLASNVFVWPNAIDENVFRDYQEKKSIPVTISGSMTPRYPWRHKVYNLILHSFPTLVCPHAGYVSNIATSRMLYGEAYARILNTSLFSPTCGSVVNDLVRKHLEIPGSKACLITERTLALDEAGFVDMQNCIFADERDVVEKISSLLADRNRLAEITASGYELIHTKHTQNQRDQILNWFNLNAGLLPGQKIAQVSPFLPMQIVANKLSFAPQRTGSDAAHLKVFRRGDDLFAAGDYDGAEQAYLRTLSYLSEFPEAKLKIGLCKLFSGNARLALTWIVQPIRCTLASYQADSPDPIEWAYFILCLLCLGRIRSAARRALQFPHLQHPELDRVRAAISLLSRDFHYPRSSSDGGHSYRRSIHKLAELGEVQWHERLCRTLKSCGQDDIAQTLETGFNTCGLRPQSVQLVSKLSSAINSLIQPRPTLHRFDNPELVQKFKQKLNVSTSNAIGKISRKLGYAETLGVSDRRAKLSEVVQKIGLDGPYRSALCVGTSSFNSNAESLYSDFGSAKFACLQLPSPPRSGLSSLLDSIRGLIARSDISALHCGGSFQRILFEKKQEYNTNSFDIVFLDAYALSEELATLLFDEIQSAKIVIVDGLESPCGRRLFGTLATKAPFHLVATDVNGQGFGIFKRHSVHKREWSED